MVSDQAIQEIKNILSKNDIVSYTMYTLEQADDIPDSQNIFICFEVFEMWIYGKLYDYWVDIQYVGLSDSVSNRIKELMEEYLMIRVCAIIVCINLDDISDEKSYELKLIESLKPYLL